MQYILYSKATVGGGAYVSSTASGGASVRSTSSGGQSTQTSSSGGGVSTSTASGGGTVQSTSAKTFAQLNLMSGVPENAVGEENYGYHLHEVQISGDKFSHDHDVTVPAHTHNFNVPAHTHSVSVPAHSHDVDIPAHTHGINVPNHSHDIEHGIFELDTLPTAVELRVDGNLIPITATSASTIDIIPYLDTDSTGKVTRGWHTVSLRPNKLGRITAQIYSQVFIQSRGGGDY